MHIFGIFLIVTMSTSSDFDFRAAVVHPDTTNLDQRPVNPHRALEPSDFDVRAEMTALCDNFDAIQTTPVALRVKDFDFEPTACTYCGEAKKLHHLQSPATCIDCRYCRYCGTRNSVNHLIVPMICVNCTCSGRG